MATLTSPQPAITAACSIGDNISSFVFNHYGQVVYQKEHHAEVVKVLVIDPRVYSASAAVISASEHGRINLLELMLAHPRAVITKDALCAADRGSHDAAIRLLTAAQPQDIRPLLKVETLGSPSTFIMLLAVKRTQSEQVAGRLSDVLREVVSEFARFEFEVCDVGKKVGEV
jgi:hypothetical protein